MFCRILSKHYAGCMRRTYGGTKIPMKTRLAVIKRGQATNGFVSTMARGSVGGASCWWLERFEKVERTNDLREGRRFPDTGEMLRVTLNQMNNGTHD